ncbi:MAG: ABC transporter permease [Actinomycetota bacterium]|nr:ABC transporter permease [Actinomycetota bacterium]
MSGRSPWRIAGRRLVRNRIAMAALALFLLIVVVSFLAPLYAHRIAHTDPFVSNISGTTVVNGKRVDVVQQGGGGLGLGEVPIRPTWHSNYFLGADNQGRDVMARVLYGGRASLQIGIASAVICCLIALVLALVAGFFRGWLDAGLSRVMDLIWAFPVYLLAISLATVLLTTPGGLKLGFVNVDASSLWVPTLIIALVYIPYVFRPVRGQVLSVREKEYVEASISQGASNLRLMFAEILPNVISTVIVMLPLMIATTVLTESALSFLSIGVQAPQASWGTVIEDGQGLLYTRPWVAIAPGIMIVLTVLSLNVLGDGVRDALDPRAKVRVSE